MDYDKAMVLLDSAHFLFSEPLLVGSLQEAVGYPLGFPSHLPLRFKLPPIEDNLAEGVVIKPLKCSMVACGNEIVRAIFKNKLEKFSERRPVPKLVEDGKSTVDAKDLNDFEISNLDMIRYEMYALVTEQRLINTISKLGFPSTRKEWTYVKGLLFKDVVESLKEDNPELWDSVVGNGVVMEILMRATREQCSQLVMACHEREKEKIERLETESLDKLSHELHALATEQHLVSFIHKTNTVLGSGKDVKKLKKLFIADISKQLKTDHNEAWACIADTVVMATLLKSMGQVCSQVVDTYQRQRTT